MSLVDHLCSGVVKGDNGVGVGGNLRLEGLMLLDFSLVTGSRGQVLAYSEKSYFVKIYKLIIINIYIKSVQW